MNKIHYVVLCNSGNPPSNSLFCSMNEFSGMMITLSPVHTKLHFELILSTIWFILPAKHFIKLKTLICCRCLQACIIFSLYQITVPWWLSQDPQWFLQTNLTSIKVYWQYSLPQVFFVHQPFNSQKPLMKLISTVHVRTHQHI